MYMIIMFAGRTIKPFMGGFELYKEAEEICDYYNWIYHDENGFEWDLDIIEE